MRPIINSEKRILQISLGNVSALAVTGTTLVDCVQDPTASAPDAVPPGTVVKALYLELWLLGSGQQPNTSTVLVEKRVGLSDPPDFAQMQNLNAYTNKKNILETHQGLVGDANTNPSPFFRGWIKIPKGKQRFGIGDRMGLMISAITEDLQFCGICIFKAYN